MREPVRRLLRGLARVPVWAWLAAIVVVSFAFRATIVRGIVAPFIMVDELIWSEVARGIADTGRPQLRGEPNPGYSVVYPLLLSPFYAVFERLPEAYAAVKTFNAAAVSLAAFPAYVLARRVLAPPLSLVAALAAVAVPSLAYAGTVMTENVFYPLFLVLAYALLLVLERPSPGRIFLLFLLFALAYGTRVQTAALVPAAVLAPVALAAFRRGAFLATLVRFRLLYAVLVALGASVLAVQLARGESLRSLLGAYASVGDATYQLDEVLRYLVWHAAELTLYVLVVPVAATIVLLGRARSLDARLQEYLAALLALVVCLLPSVAAFASVFSQRIQERNLFYLAPLLVIALLAWIERGAPRPRALAIVAAGASALLVLLVPYERFITTSAVTDTLMLLPLWSLQDRTGMSWIPPLAFALAAALGTLFLVLPRRFALALPLVVVALWAVAFKSIWWGKHGFVQAASGALFQGIRTTDRDWIDRVLPDGAEAAFLWTGRTDRLTVNQNEFFNRKVGPVFHVAERTPGHLPETAASIDPDTGRVTLADGADLGAEYLLTDTSFEPDGEALAVDLGWGITLWRVRPPLLSTVRVDGLYPNDTWSGRTVSYLRRRCQEGRLFVRLTSDPSLFLRPQTVVAHADGEEVARVRLRPDGRARLVVPLTPRPGTDECRVGFTVTPTAVPALVTNGENPDDRELGAHFNRFRYAVGDGLSP